MPSGAVIFGDNQGEQSGPLASFCGLYLHQDALGHLSQLWAKDFTLRCYFEFLVWGVSRETYRFEKFVDG